MIGTKQAIPVAALTGLCLVALSATPVLAASECKGLPQAECEAKAECKWIEAYTRKDGKEVGPYCRSVGKKPSEGAGSNQQPAQ